MLAMDNVLELESFMSVYCKQTYAVTLGRAAWGIALTLKSLAEKLRRETEMTTFRIAVPSFLCQSPLGAILLEQWEPVFCDIDLDTAMVSLSEWEKAFKNGVQAALLVHMFGNPCQHTQGISELCKKYQVFLLEDVCLALGAKINHRPCGSWGDAAFFSFGHTKLIDVGSGGLVATSHQWLDESIRKHEATLNKTPEELRAKIAETFLKKFYDAKKYLVIDETTAKKKFSGLIYDYLPLVSQNLNVEIAEKITDKLKNLSVFVSQRVAKALLYKNKIKVPIQVFGMEAGMVPWRFVFRIPGISRLQQETLSDDLRKNGVHISNWYLPLHWICSHKTSYLSTLPQTEILSREIFQLWLTEDTDDDTINRNCEIFSKSYEKLQI